jgi:hypothetical protein
MKQLFEDLIQIRYLTLRSCLREFIDKSEGNNRVMIAVVEDSKS